MAQTPEQPVTFEKPKTVWVVGAWLSSVAAVMAAGMLGSLIPYGAVFTALVGAWTVYAVGDGWSRTRKVMLGLLAVWTVGLDSWLDYLNSLAPGWPSTGLIGLSIDQTAMLLSACLMVVVCFVSGLLTGLVTMTRSARWWCTSACSLMLLVALGIEPVAMTSVVAWHGVVFGVIVSWAVRTRTRRLSGSHCAGCGYDLAGIEGPVCPECGRARVTAAAPASKA